MFHFLWDYVFYLHKILNTFHLEFNLSRINVAASPFFCWYLWIYYSMPLIFNSFIDVTHNTTKLDTCFYATQGDFLKINVIYIPFVSISLLDFTFYFLIFLL